MLVRSEQRQTSPDNRSTRTNGKGQCVESWPSAVNEIGAALAALADASLNGEHAVIAAATTWFPAFVGGGSASVMIRAGNDWKYADIRTVVTSRMAQILNTSVTPTEVIDLPSVGTFIPLQLGSMGVLLRDWTIAKSHWPGLRILATGFELALAAATQSREALNALREISGLQQIARRILSAGDPEEILASICNETKRLLSADICGVFLQQGDQMVMRGCVGHHTQEIAQIALRRGQGLAGRVFETGSYCKVNDYLKSEILTQEHAELVRAERIRSALGAPLHVNDELIGVLEVWRRRDSTFTGADVRRVVALAGLTAIAITNAQLYKKQRCLVEQVVTANERLQKQNSIISKSAEITEAVIQALLDGEGLSALARVVVAYASVEVVFLTYDLQTMGNISAPSWLGECIPLIKRVVSGRQPGLNKSIITLPLDEGWLLLRSVIAGRDLVGWICALSREQPGHLQEVTITQAAIAVALNYLEQLAAVRARAEIRGGIVWDLLEGTAYARQNAVSRGKELQVNLRGPLRVVHFAVDGLNDTDSAARERGLKLVQEICERELYKSGALRLIVTRGSFLVAIITAIDSSQIKPWLKAIDERVVQEVSGLRTFCGVSSPCANPGNLHAAHSEAASAIQAVRKLKFGRNIAFHEELGFIGLLLKIRSDADLDKFVKDILSKVIARDSRNKNVLMRTVRAYFDCNCAQNTAAKKLYVHEKTVRYRLCQFEKLTGMDLSRHEDRLLIDLALRMYAIAVDSNDASEVRALG